MGAQISQGILAGQHGARFDIEELDRKQGCPTRSKEPWLELLFFFLALVSSFLSRAFFFSAGASLLPLVLRPRSPRCRLSCCFSSPLRHVLSPPSSLLLSRFSRCVKGRAATIRPPPVPPLSLAKFHGRSTRRLLEIKELTIWLTVVMVKHHDLAMGIENFLIDFVILVYRFLQMEVLGGALEKKLVFVVFTMVWKFLMMDEEDGGSQIGWQGDSREGRRWSTVVFWVVRCEKDEPATVDHGGAWSCWRRVEWKIIQT
ncbi:hypothetical protein LR48_Vigan07g186900 [Vigna angularis]|uniref:Uncharacterized protein n=1 Tax=Phaseolus angularis TaxID=3914 RepID=A0A0L9UZ76_PHAAN|nr:hypothetical protein LR48_Vigan07g186900 [Vigna angularis]